MPRTFHSRFIWMSKPLPLPPIVRSCFLLLIGTCPSPFKLLLSNFYAFTIFGLKGLYFFVIWQIIPFNNSIELTESGTPGLSVRPRERLVSLICKQFFLFVGDSPVEICILAIITKPNMLRHYQVAQVPFFFIFGGYELEPCCILIERAYKVEQ